MKTSKIAILSLIGLGLSLANLQASIATYSSEAAFDAAAPGIAVQTFGAVTTGAMDNSLNSGTGPILAGLDIAATGANGGDLYVTPAGFSAQTYAAVYANFFVETMTISFSLGQSAVGLGLKSQYEESMLTISVYDTSSFLIGTYNSWATSAGAGTFFGLTTSGGDLIGSINLSSTTGQAEGVDLVKFGSAGSVPDGGSTALLAALAMGALMALRRKFSAV